LKPPLRALAGMPQRTRRERLAVVLKVSTVTVTVVMGGFLWGAGCLYLSLLCARQHELLGAVVGPIVAAVGVYGTAAVWWVLKGERGDR
jgi:hypothetical protein